MSVAIYPGSFDPPTIGHLDIIERASKIFDEVIVLASVNVAKKSFFNLEQRSQMLKASVSHISNVKVDSFSGLMVDYVGSKKDAVIVRGLRAILDFEYEFQMALINRHLDREIETVFLMTSMKYAHISSSLVREIFSLGGDISSMVPQPVLSFCNKRG